MLQTSVLIKVFIGRITLTLSSFTVFSFANSKLHSLEHDKEKVTMKSRLDSESTIYGNRISVLCFHGAIHGIMPLTSKH
jgi:hypothetical protein